MKTDNEYANVHQWLARHYGKAIRCDGEQCTSVSPKRYEWALKKGFEYKRDVSHFMQLCASCHRKYDYTDEHRKKLSIAKLGKPAKHRKPVQQFSKEGQLIASYVSISEAAQSTGTDRTSINNCLNGEHKTANGFLWKRLTTSL